MRANTRYRGAPRKHQQRGDHKLLISSAVLLPQPGIRLENNLYTDTPKGNSPLVQAEPSRIVGQRTRVMAEKQLWIMCG